MSIAKAPELGPRVNLVVVDRITAESIHVVTSYPVKDVTGEIQRKIEVGRWIPSTLEGWP